tara:strand:- start:15216 stop:15719 length:504 start_codon:yes stop_codon:yes gene_type:complete
MKTKIFITTILLSVMIHGCTNDGVSRDEIKKLAKAEKTWGSNKTSNYAYNYLQSCFCPYFGELKVVVQADTVFAVLDPVTLEDATIVQGEEEVKMIDLYTDYFITIDKLFEKLKEASLNAYEMKGTYDSETGYPRNVFIDYIEDGVDDEITYQLGSLENLNSTLLRD